MIGIVRIGLVQRGQRLDHRRGLGVLLAAGIEELAVHQREERGEIVGAAEFLEERPVVMERPAHLAQIFFRHEEQRLRAEHFQVEIAL